jgi:2-methoxy-6-polyprenyl-1,4-benzoquinol methylase
VLGNAEDLSSEKESTYDAYTISFGIRNCTHLDKVVKEAYRVLKPGGRFMCLEFSNVENAYFRRFVFFDGYSSLKIGVLLSPSRINSRLYDMYSFQVIPVMGHLIAGDWDSYQYLVESIRVFPKQVN